MRYTLGRWSLFPVFSVPVQLLLYLVYPIAALVYLFYHRPKYVKRISYLMPEKPLEGVSDEEIKSKIDALKVLPNKLRDEFFFDTEDNHNLLMHCHLYQDPRYFDLVDKALSLTLDPKSGAILRKFPLGTHNKVSNDCHSGWLVTWVLAYYNKSLSNYQYHSIRDSAMKASWHFLKHCFGVKDVNDSAVSDRDSCGGVNLVGDGWRGLGWPCGGVYFFTGIAQIAVAVKAAPWYLKPFWEFWYHLYFWTMTGPWMALAPYLHEHGDDRYFHEHIIMNEIYVLRKMRPWSMWWWISTWWMLRINQPHKLLINPWFHALAYDAGSKLVDPEYIKRITLMVEYSATFQWQKTPLYPHIIGKGAESYPASRTSIFYILEKGS